MWRSLIAEPASTCLLQSRPVSVSLYVCSCALLLIRSSVFVWSHMEQNPVSTQSHSSGCLPLRCPTIPLQWASKPAARLSFPPPFHGTSLRSRFSPHKPLNTSASAANGLQQCKGNIYNYSLFALRQRLQSLTQLLVKKTRCFVCFRLHFGFFHNWKPGSNYASKFGGFRMKSVCIYPSTHKVLFVVSQQSRGLSNSRASFLSPHVPWEQRWKIFGSLRGIYLWANCFIKRPWCCLRRDRTVRLNPAPASIVHTLECSLALCYINSCGWEGDRGSSVRMLLDYSNVYQTNKEKYIKKTAEFCRECSGLTCLACRG